MKKLALASVAFAGVTAFGAGDSFAVGFTPYETGPAGFAYTDTTVWNPVGGGSNGGVGGTAGQTGHSAIKNIGVTASFAATTSTADAALTIFNQNCAGGANTRCVGFKANTHMLGNNAFEGTGTIELSFTHGLSALGFSLSNAPPDWGAQVTFFDGTAILGTAGFSGKPNCAGTGGDLCHNPAFLGAIVTGAVITGASVGLTHAGPLYIGELYETEAVAKIPEPATLSVLGAGLLGLGALRRRRRARDSADGSRWSPFGRWRVVNGPPDTKDRLS
jgi:hypothetical protein